MSEGTVRPDAGEGGHRDDGPPRARGRLTRAAIHLVDRTPDWLEKYQVPIALLGILGGVASYWFIDRQPGLAAGIAMATLAGWALLLLEALVLSSLPDTRWGRAGTGMFQLTLQTIHQEALFFVVTFAVLSTHWRSGQIAFTGLIIALTAIASIDPIYHLTLARSRIALLCFHALTMFLCGFMALPIAFQEPLDEALLYSIGFSMLATWPLLFRVTSGSRRRRAAQTTLIVASICVGLWTSRSLLPPMSTKLEDAAISRGFDLAAKEPIGASASFATSELGDAGLYAYTPIRAPLGLNQGVIHEWRLGGELIDSIPMEITGGRQLGFRAWSHKLNFPDRPEGDWTVTVRTPRGIVLGSVAFRVVGAPSPDPGG